MLKKCWTSLECPFQSLHDCRFSSLWTPRLRLVLIWMQKYISNVKMEIQSTRHTYIATFKVPKVREWQMKASNRIQTSTFINKIQLCHVIQAKVNQLGSCYHHTLWCHWHIFDFLFFIEIEWGELCFCCCCKWQHRTAWYINSLSSSCKHDQSEFNNCEFGS